jgi:hypothetical protein
MTDRLTRRVIVLYQYDLIRFSNSTRGTAMGAIVPYLLELLGAVDGPGMVHLRYRVLGGGER